MTSKPRPEFLALAEQCGARLAGKPDGSEAVTVVFTIPAWRAFDAELAKPDACPAPAEPQSCSLGCTTECKAKMHGCASECPALPWQPPAPAEPQDTVLNYAAVRAQLGIAPQPAGGERPTAEERADCDRKLALQQASYEREMAALRAALAELVALAELKAAIEMWVIDTVTGKQWPKMQPYEARMAACDDYTKRKPLAFAAARAALKETS